MPDPTEGLIQKLARDIRRMEKTVTSTENALNTLEKISKKDPKSPLVPEIEATRRKLVRQELNLEQKEAALKALLK